MRGSEIQAAPDQQPDDSSGTPEPLAAPQGCCEESQAHQGRGGICWRLLDTAGVVKPVHLGRLVACFQGSTHRVVSTVTPVSRVGPLQCAGLESCGRRPVVWSFGSGSATRIPEMTSRPAAAALAAARAICSAVTAPADTPRTVAVVRVVWET